MRRPVSIVALSLLLIIGGGFAAWDMLMDWEHGQMTFNFGILGTVVGIGLLAGSEVVRRVTLGIV